MERAKMPKIPLSDADFEAVVKYMVELKGN